MKLKTPVIRSIIIISILVLSVLIGFVFSVVCGKIDQKKYPRPAGYSEYVEKYAEKYAVPEYIMYAVIKNESNFDSGHKNDDGGIGLMGVTFEEFDDMRQVTREELTNDALYGPETNIRYGALKLSLLYNRFESWSFVCAAYCAGDKYEAWLEDEANFDEDGKFTRVPDEVAVKNGEKLYSIAEKYAKMYYGE
jgi:soluble lytic murein transglycosylase